MNTQTKGLLITTLGVLFIVPDSLFIRLIQADSLTIVFWRSIISGTVILMAVIFRHGRGTMGAITQTGTPGIIYSLSMGISAIFFIQAVSNTSVANVVFIIATMPIFAAGFSRVFLGESISKRMILTILGVVSGLAVITYGTGQSQGTGMLGNIYALGSAATFAAALTASRKARSVSMVPMISVSYIGTALLVWPFTEIFAVLPDQWWLIGVHGAVIIVFSTAFLSIGPRYITSAEVALLILLESILAPLLVWAVLGENPGIWVVAGGAIIVGVLLVSNTVALIRTRHQP
ncbi:MAG: DMT family transporter [Paracoccaceae bacterium]